MTPVINCSAVSTTLAINLCHGFSLIGGVVDTGDKFITGVVDNITTIPVITFFPGVVDTGHK
jgi:hypothetical protein